MMKQTRTQECIAGERKEAWVEAKLRMMSGPSEGFNQCSDKDGI
jgi:hypothetical protein